MGTAVGAGLGGLGVGLLTGLLGTIAFFHCRSTRYKPRDSLLDLRGNSHPGSPQGAYLTVPSVTSHYHAVPNSAGLTDNSLGLSTQASSSFANRISNAPSGTQYHIEPFIMPPVTEDGRLRPITSPTHANPSNPSLNTAPSAPETSIRPTSAGRTQSQVYVVHHDGGRAPVTVYTQEGTQVVELPPGYPGGAGEDPIGPLRSPHSHVGHDARSDLMASSAGAGSGSSDAGRTENNGPVDPPAFLQRPRRPGQIQKPSTSKFGRPGSSHT